AGSSFLSPFHTDSWFHACPRDGRAQARNGISSDSFAAEGAGVAPNVHSRAASGGIRAQQSACRLHRGPVAQAGLGRRDVAALRRAAFAPAQRLAGNDRAGALHSVAARRTLRSRSGYEESCRFGSVLWILGL